MKKCMFLFLAMAGQLHPMMRRMPLTSQFNSNGTIISPSFQCFQSKEDDSLIVPHGKRKIISDPKMFLYQIYEEELLQKIADIFQTDLGTVHKGKITLTDVVFIEKFIEFFAAAQACNYKELKEVHFKNSIGLDFLEKAYLLAEGKEVIFQGLKRIDCSDVDEILRLIKNKIEDIKDIIYQNEFSNPPVLEMQENFDN